MRGWRGDDCGRYDWGRTAGDLEPVDVLAAAEVGESDHMRAGCQRERCRDRRVGFGAARVRDGHGAARVAVDGQCDLAVVGPGADAEVRGVGAARGNRHRILGPFAIDDPADVRDAVGSLDVDSLTYSSGAAGVSGRGVVVGNCPRRRYHNPRPEPGREWHAAR